MVVVCHVRLIVRLVVNMRRNVLTVPLDFILRSMMARGFVCLVHPSVLTVLHSFSVDFARLAHIFRLMSVLLVMILTVMIALMELLVFYVILGISWMP